MSKTFSSPNERSSSTPLNETLGLSVMGVICESQENRGAELSVTFSLPHSSESVRTGRNSRSKIGKHERPKSLKWTFKNIGTLLY